MKWTTKFGSAIVNYTTRIMTLQSFCLRFGMLAMWHVQDVGCFHRGMLGTWDIWEVGRLVSRIFRILNVWDLRCLRCGLLRTCNVYRDTEFWFTKCLHLSPIFFFVFLSATSLLHLFCLYLVLSVCWRGFVQL